MQQQPTSFEDFFPGLGRPTTLAELVGGRVQDTVKVVLALSKALDAAPDCGPWILVSEDTDLDLGVPPVACQGAGQLSAAIENVMAMPTGAPKEFGTIAIALYGLWLFPGVYKWATGEEFMSDTFEADVLGILNRRGSTKRSTVSHSALHPLEIVTKYVLLL